MLRPRLILVLIASTIFTAAICAFVFWMLAKGEESASKASTQFATALVKNDPSLAPKGGADHVEGAARPVRRSVGRARHRDPQPSRRQR